MFTKVSVKMAAQNVDLSSSPPNQHDLNEILDILNKGRLCERISPREGNVEDFVDKSLKQFIANNPPLTIPNCHSISKLVAQKSPYELNRVTGYIIKKSVEANFRNATPPHLSYPPFFLCVNKKRMWKHGYTIIP